MTANPKPLQRKAIQLHTKRERLQTHLTRTLHDLDSCQLVGSADTISNRIWWLQFWYWQAEHGVLWLEIGLGVPKDVTSGDPPRTHFNISCSLIELEDDETDVTFVGVDMQALDMVYLDLMETLPRVWREPATTEKSYKMASDDTQVEDSKVWKELKCELPIELEHFRTWFAEATVLLLTDAAPTFETPEGSVFLMARTDSLDEGYHYVNAHFEDVENKTPIPSQPTWGDGVIQFNARSFGPARLGVYAVCYREELVPYFEELVALLRQRYPGARAESIVQAKLDNYMERLHQPPFCQERLVYANDTDVASVGTWLQNHTQGISSRRFPTERGYVVLEPAKIVKVTGHSRNALDVKMVCIYIYKNKEGEEQVWGGQSPAISFRLIITNNSRVEIRAQCGQPSVAGYFSKELLAALGMAFNIVELQTVEVIDQQLKGKAGAKRFDANDWLHLQRQENPSIPLPKLGDEYKKKRAQEGKPLLDHQDVDGMMRAALSYRRRKERKENG